MHFFFLSQKSVMLIMSNKLFINRGYELLYSLATVLKLKQLTADSPQTTSTLAKKFCYYIIISYLKVSEIIKSCTTSVADVI